MTVETALISRIFALIVFVWCTFRNNNDFDDYMRMDLTSPKAPFNRFFKYFDKLSIYEWIGIVNWMESGN